MDLDSIGVSKSSWELIQFSSRLRLVIIWCSSGLFQYMDVRLLITVWKRMAERIYGSEIFVIKGQAWAVAFAFPGKVRDTLILIEVMNWWSALVRMMCDGSRVLVVIEEGRTHSSGLEVDTFHFKWQKLSYQYSGRWVEQWSKLSNHVVTANTKGVLSITDKFMEGRICGGGCRLT